jgi:hypothetical protein
MPADKYLWGNCKRPGQLSIDSDNRKADGAFTWADKTCSYFKPGRTKNTGESTSKENTDVQESMDSR